MRSRGGIRAVAAAALFGVMLAGPGACVAEDYPAKPIRMIAAAAPGGSLDILARLLSQHLGAVLDQPIVVENRAGGAGSLAATAVAAAPKDGYTLMLSASQMVAQAAAFRAGSSSQIAYDPIRDFSPIALIGYGPIVLGVNSAFPANSVGELVALVRANPGKYSFSSCGNGSPQHLAGELLNLSAKIDLAHVAYRGCAPAVIDAVSGTVPIFLTVINNALPFVKGGKLRLLGVATLKRLPGYPDLPTIAESGLPGFDASPWFGVLGPAGLPHEVIAKLNTSINAVMSKPEVNEKLRAMMMEPAAGTPEQFSKIMRDELERWTRVVREAKIKID
jgi:tripartite-type tricarboxylate transporter receptor subunit TctC